MWAAMRTFLDLYITAAKTVPYSRVIIVLRHEICIFEKKVINISHAYILLDIQYLHLDNI